MTIAYHAGGRITGLSSDTKPTNVADHTIFHETDTGDDYTILSGVWTLKHTTLSNSITNDEIAAHTSTKITITNKTQLPSTTVFDNDVNNFTVAAQRYGNSVLSFLNPLATFSYSVITNAITTNRNITLPLLTANDTFVFEDHSQTLTNKGLVASMRIQGFKGADVASADAITLGEGNYFDITGAVTINHLLTTNWQAGSEITLQFDSTPTITNAAGGATGDEADFALAGGTNWTTVTAGDTLTLVYDGTVWRETSRSVN